ncbi:hypothetical protein [Rhizobium leguminosarum]|uniref:hypothetical protein n=1 Tax=Rhizobium leguminosarum TaxID=384 RepID=UPI0021BBDD19|nr:hypothetical protein [Rhizobium leguminosarum]
MDGLDIASVFGRNKTLLHWLQNLRCREEQLWLTDCAIWTVADAKLFELNSGMHEAIIECCQNSFFIDTSNASIGCGA